MKSISMLKKLILKMHEDRMPLKVNISYTQKHVHFLGDRSPSPAVVRALGQMLNCN